MNRAIIRTTLLAVIAMTVFLISSCGRQGPVAPPDTTPPSIVGTSPASYAQNVAPNASISVTFSEPVDGSSIIFTLTTGSVTVDCTLAYSGQTAIFSHAVPLAYGTTYTATIKAGLRDPAGNVMSIDAPWTFTVGANPDNIPPQVIDIQPSSRKTGVSPNTAIFILFSEALDSSTTSSTTIKLSTVNGYIPVTVTYNGLLNAAVITPTHNLAINTTHFVTATTGIKDLAGNAMSQAFVSTFKTGSSNDSAPPSISGTIPSSGATGVSVNTPIAMTFSEPIDISTLSLANIVVSDGTATITASINYINTTMLLTPSSPLAYDTLYTVTMGKGISDLAHNIMTADYTCSFRTERQGPDVTPPAIVWIDPNDTETNVPVYKPVTALFSEKILSTTVTPTSFILVDPNGNTVPGQMVLNGSLAAYLPAQPFDFNTTYTAIIDQSLTDLAGNPVAAGKTWSFTTQPVAAFSIIASAGTGGTITPSGATSVNYNGSQQYTITPATGYSIADVQVDGSSVGTVPSLYPSPYTYTFSSVTSDHTISVTFSVATYAITATTGPNGSISPSGSVPVNYGANQTFTIIPATGYYIADVQVDGSSVVPAPQSYTFTNVIASHAINALFSINTYTINFVAGPNGSLTGGATSQSVTYGGSATAVTATATTPNYHFVNWTDANGVVISTANPLTVTNVTASQTLTANFAIDTYVITTSVTGSGTISPINPAVNYDASQTFTITPAAGYSISDVQVDGVSLGPVTSYTFNNVVITHTISASFAINTYTITVSAGAGGSVSPAGPVSVNYGASQTFTFTPSAGYYVSAVLVDGVDQGLINSYTFTNVTTSHSLQVSFALGTNTITATAGIGGSITSGTTVVPSGTSQDFLVDYGGYRSFTIAPNAGYQINTLLVDGVSISPPTSYTFTNVTTNHTISATFTINTYSITSSAGANGTITPSGTVTVNYGGNQTFTITANVGYHVADVQVDNVSVGAVTSYPFTNVTGNHTINATFSIDTYTISASAGTGGTITPSGTVTVNYGGNQTFTITANVGYHVADVQVDSVSVGAVTSYPFTNVTGNHTISATFAIDTYTITASASVGGTISPSGAVSVAYGGNQTFTIAPIAGYHIADVMVDGASVGIVTSYPFTNVTGNHTIDATFALNTYTIVASAGANGTISPSGAVSIGYGGNQAFTITPNTGYQVSDVQVDGASVGAVTSYSFTNVTGNHTIDATFMVATYTITASGNAGGTISPSGAVSVTYGGSQTFAITANTPAYYVSDVQIDGASIGPVASYTFTNVTGNHTINVTFAIYTFTITASYTGKGSITPSGSVIVNYGANQIFTMSPPSKLLDVLVDGVSVGAVPSYTFTSVVADHTIVASFQ